MPVKGVWWGLSGSRAASIHLVNQRNMFAPSRWPQKFPSHFPSCYQDKQVAKNE